MTIASELEKTREYLKNAYDAMEAKGITVVGDKNLANLADNILYADDMQTEWGSMYYYSEFEKSYPVQRATKCTVNDIDVEKLDGFLGDSGEVGMLMFRFSQTSEEDSGGETIVTRVWEYNSTTILEEDMLDTTGIDVTVSEGATSANFSLRGAVYDVDTDSEIVQVALLNEDEYNSLGGKEVYTIGGNSVYRGAVTRFVFGTEPTTIPDRFLMSTTVQSINTTRCRIQTIGEYAFSGCEELNCPISLPEVTTVGQSFLSNASKFDGVISLPKVTSIGGNFLVRCYSFNQPLDFPMVETIGGGFLSNCTSFNQDIRFPNSLTSIGTSCMYNCKSMTSVVSFGALRSSVLTASNLNFATGDENADCYTVGIKVSPNGFGLANQTTNPFRKIIGYSVFEVEVELTDGTILRRDPVRSTFESASTTSTITIEGQNINKSAVKSIRVLKDTGLYESTQSWTTPPGLRGFSNLETVEYSDEALNNYSYVPYSYMETCPKFNSPIYFPFVSAVGEGFLKGARSFNSEIRLPKITRIPTYFLNNCVSFNQPLALLSNLVGIGAFFLYNCTSFNQNITIPSSVMSVGIQFMHGCNAMTGTVYCGTPKCPVDTSSAISLATEDSTADCYATGITLSGPYAQAWKDALPDSDIKPYRKLVVVDTE